MLENLETLAQAVESAHANIAPEYQDYFMLANAIATDCGEAGRSVFHRLCRFSPKYRPQPADKIFDNMLRTNLGRVHLGTVYHLARQAGVRVEKRQTDAPDAVDAVHFKSHTRARTSEDDTAGEDILTGSEPLSRLPTFPDYQWPEPLNTIINYGQTPQQRDILLLGAVTVLGATLGKKVRCHYGRRFLSPNLQTFIVAPPASGKGVLSFLLHFATPIHKQLRKQYEAKMKAYQQEKAAYDTAGKERAKQTPPERPVNKMFLFAGNNSGTGLLQNIMDADGEGLIFEPEADTLSTAIGAEYGRFSDTLRKTFDHDRISYNRRTDQEYKEVDKTYLSVLISGTPAQVKPLIPDAENGLFSRHLFYYMPTVRQWQNQFDETDTNLEEEFKRMGKEWKNYLDTLRETSFITLHLSPEQKEAFNERFALLFEHSYTANDNEMNSSIVRLAINTCRIMSLVAVLRGDTTPSADIPQENIKDGFVQRMDTRISNDDFNAVMQLVYPLYHHGNHILSFLPTTELTRRTNSDRDIFFASLPAIFTRAQMREKARQQGIKENTAISWLNRLTRQGRLAQTDNPAEYTRVRTHVCEI